MYDSLGHLHYKHFVTRCLASLHSALANDNAFVLLVFVVILLLLPASWWCSGWVGRRTPDRKVAGSTPDRSAIKSTRSSQPSIPRG